MTVDTKRVSGRRTLRFDNLDELIAEAERVATTPCRTIGNWTVGEILQHLALAANAPFDGFGGFKAPWIARTLIAPILKNNVITKGMPSGIKLPKQATALIPDPGCPNDRGLAALKQALSRFKHEVPQVKHPFFGSLALQEWISLNLRHAELHLSFIIPEEVNVTSVSA